MSGNYERELVDNINDLDLWIAQRATGSMGECDVSAHLIKHLATKDGGLNTPIHQGILFEVKKSKRGRDNFKSWGEQSMEQLQHYIELHEEGFNVWYAFRYMRGPWKFFSVPHQLQRDKPHIFVREEGISFEEMFNE